VGALGLEPRTSALSERRSSQLSYAPGRASAGSLPAAARRTTAVAVARAEVCETARQQGAYSRPTRRTASTVGDGGPLRPSLGAPPVEGLREAANATSRDAAGRREHAIGGPPGQRGEIAIGRLAGRQREGAPRETRSRSATSTVEGRRRSRREPGPPEPATGNGDEAMPSLRGHGPGDGAADTRKRRPRAEARTTRFAIRPQGLGETPRPEIAGCRNEARPAIGDRGPRGKSKEGYARHEPTFPTLVSIIGPRGLTAEFGMGSGVAPRV
jgi:hypothetical protein